MTTFSNIIAFQQLFVFLQIIIASFCLLFSNDVLSKDIDVEYKIKAAYLYNFTKFVYWPPKNTLTFNICLIGHDSFGNIINPIEQKMVQGKKIQLFRYANLSQSFEHCYIIYFSLLATIKVRPDKNFKDILTIGEHDSFIHQGGMIRLFKNNNHIKFQINKQLIEKNGLEISAKLLELADIIEGNHE